MKRTLLVLAMVLALLIAGWMGSRVQLAIEGRQGQTATCTPQANGENQGPATVGEPVVIGLAANESTPYRWTLDQLPDPSVAIFVGAQYFYTGSPRLVGGGGVDCLTFWAVGRGTTTVQLSEQYIGAAPDRLPAQTRAFTITVGAGSS